MEDNNEIIQALLSAARKPSPGERYRTLRFALKRLVDINVRDVRVQFSGLFAKTSYLLSAHKADPALTRAVSGARRRIRHFEEMTEQDQERYFPHDLKSVTAFQRLLNPEVEIPGELISMLPSGNLEDRWERAGTDCLRIIVKSFSATEIIGVSDEDGSPDVTVVYGPENKYLGFDYSYLTPLLSPGTQLNIVRPRQEKGKQYPEIIIYEPDYLVDISALASAFKEYGETPLTMLIRKISPNCSTKATLLGDFASQLLDEELHGQYERPYAESISEFCRKHVLSMAACKDLDAGFHQDAMRQKENIHRAISHDLPQAVSGFSPKDVVLEPSFICERLGIQGRMDFLSRDNRLLIEQKSGKAAYIPRDGLVCPKMSLPHYMQLLLYRALLHYNFDIPNEQIRPFLLYSKYERPLLNIDSAPELLHRAFRLRNGIVWNELMYERKGFGILETLSADDLNVAGTKNNLWLNYTRPQTESLLQPIRNASPTEKAYFMVMMQFVQREMVLAKIGNKRKENSGLSARWHDSLEEKREAGNIIDGVSIKATATHVECEGMDMSSSNFRPGDIVTLFQYRKGLEPDCRKTIIHRATIERIDSTGMTLCLRMPQNTAAVFDTPPGCSWAVEHDFMDSSFSSLFRGVHSFLSSSQERRSLILSGRHPEIDCSQTLNGDYGSFNDLQLRVRQAKELFLIIGPPGTGKTSFGMLYTLKEELSREGSSVAVMAYTNRAVDEICSKLVEEGIDFVRIGNELLCGEEYRPYFLNNKVEGLRKIEDIRDFIRRQRVVVGTTTAFNSRSDIFSLRGFSLAIVDEASQILEPQIIGLLAAKNQDGEAIRKFVFIGDHKQLPAVVQQRPEETLVSDPLLTSIGLTDCRLSLFERLLKQYRDDPSVVYMLRHQGRMHEEIASFSNEMFYGGDLSCVPLPHQTEPSTLARVRFFHVDGREETASDKVNTMEAELIADIIGKVDPGLSVGVIVPYRIQISAVRQALARIPGWQERQITIDTVERFQGSQRDVIIYGFTVRHRYQMEFLTDNCFTEDGKVIDRKLNVVLTRAKRYLFLVGNAGLLAQNDVFRELIEKYSEKPINTQDK